MTKPKVIIIGAGILGASTAFQLSNENAKVTLIDEADASEQATPYSFGWINAHSPENRHHFKLRVEAMAQWRTLKQKHPELPVHFPGALDWDMPQNELEETAKLYNELGNAAHILGKPALIKAAPALQNPPDAAIHCPADGVANPVEIASAFISLSRPENLTHMSGDAVVEILTSNGRVKGVKTNSQTIEADHVVLCAGRKTPQLLSSLALEVPLDNRSGMLLKTHPVENLNLPIISAPDLHFWQAQDGSLLVGENQSGATKAESDDIFKQRISDELQSMLPQQSDIRFIDQIIGIRPMPMDTMPVLGVAGQFENLHVAVMHSGITLAPIVGRAITSAILSETDYAGFEPYRLDRFAEMSAASWNIAQ